ncbi:MAG: acyltransferase family protein, partial [Deltaproteobacteria bacterium]|nr:acyltransferase family protein [Deltaproteobacteria bacterium]
VVAAPVAVEPVVVEPARARPSARKPAPIAEAEIVETPVVVPPAIAAARPAVTSLEIEEASRWDFDPTAPQPASELHDDDIDLLGRDDDEELPPRPSARTPVYAPPEDDDVPIEVAHEMTRQADARTAPKARPEHEDEDAASPEARIDRLLDEASRAADDPAARMRMAEAFSEIAHQLGGEGAVPETEDPGMLSSARELLSPEYYVKQWGRVAMRNRSEEVDDFGLDRAYEQRMRPRLELLYRRWFRAQAHGVANVPNEGRALLVGNHAGALPWDGLMLQTAIRLEHPAHREVRWLAEDFVAHTPFLGAITNRLGAVRACPENAERLLGEDKLVAVFPEGEKGLGKPWARRYEIQRFGRGGFVKLALRMKAPIVPVAIVGSEETHPTLLRSDRLARFLGVPFLPITPTFPLLGPLGLVPLPSRWVIRFGKPIDLSGEPEGTQNDPVRVQHLAEEVRSAVQSLVKRALEDRPQAF